ncbi:MAG TPA: phosphatase PAP2 family protein [Pyrinomonadaceae bacterium]|jgi:undecaprenyl-diphosphatase
MNHNSKTVQNLPLIIGVIVFIAMTVFVWQLADEIRERESLTTTDSALSSWLHTHRDLRLTTVMFAVTAMGSTQVVSSIAGLFGVYFLYRRRFYWFAAITLTVFGGMLLNKLLKYAFHRQRPFFTDPLLTLTSYSFPSGHTMMATTLYAALAIFFLSRTSDVRARVLIICAAVVMILAVGFSRIYLGAHYLTDVLGAMAEAIAWLSFCLAILYSVWVRNNPNYYRKEGRR